MLEREYRDALAAATAERLERVAKSLVATLSAT